MVFVLSSLVRAASRWLYEPNNWGYKCEFATFQKVVKTWDFVHIRLCIMLSCSIERPIVLGQPGIQATQYSASNTPPLTWYHCSNPSLWLAVVPVILYGRPAPPPRGWRPVKTISGAPTTRHSFWDYHCSGFEPDPIVQVLRYRLHNIHVQSPVCVWGGGERISWTRSPNYR